MQLSTNSFDINDALDSFEPFKEKEFKTFKGFYKYTYSELKSGFPTLLSYGRIIELKEEVQIPFAMFLVSTFGECTGISYGDSTPMPACHIKRECSHKVLKAISAKGKSTNGWFYGSKLHLVLNQYSEIINMLITPGNVANNNAGVIRHLTKGIWGKFFGDKGYMVMWHEIYEKSVQILYSIRSNMKNTFMLSEDKICMRKRANISEEVFSMLKDRMSLQYTRHRSIYGFFSNILIMLIAYQLWAHNGAQKFRTQLIENAVITY